MKRETLLNMSAFFGTLALIFITCAGLEYGNILMIPGIGCAILQIATILVPAK